MSSETATGGTVGRAKFPRVVEMRIMGASVTAIAADLGCNPATITRTLALPEVIKAIEEAHRETRMQCAAILASAATEAVRGLISIARGEGGDERPSDRRAAWNDILSMIGLNAGALTQPAPSSQVDPAALSDLLDRLARQSPHLLRRHLEAAQAERDAAMRPADDAPPS